MRAGASSSPKKSSTRCSEAASWVRRGSSGSEPPGPFQLESHPLHERLEAGLLTQRVEDRVHLEIGHPASSLVVCALHPVQSTLSVPEGDVERRQLDRRHVIELAFFSQLYGQCLAVVAFSVSRQRVSESHFRVRSRGG